MKTRNWRLWTGLLLCIAAFISYLTVFARFPITRDIPWVSFLLFAIAAYLLITGFRGATRKIIPSVVLVLGFLILGGFTYFVTLGSKNLPGATRAPAVGEKAPAFTLRDTNNRPVTLSELTANSRGVLLIFYRGYW